MAEYTKAAFDIWLPDQQVQAITPFILNYHAAPLDVFSWLDRDGQDYLHCQMVREMAKTTWHPEQITAWEVEFLDLPKFLPINSTYRGKITLKNTGQSIWGEQGLSFKSLSELAGDITLPNGIMVEPNQSFQFNFDIRAPQWPEEILLSWENLETKAQINFFNPSRLDSYQDNFWQKIVALVKVWWYKKIPDSKTNDQENHSQQ